MKYLFAVLLVLNVFAVGCKNKKYIKQYPNSYLDDTLKHLKGDTVLPFGKYSFDNTGWYAEIEFFKDDKKDLSNKVPRARKLTTSDIEVLNMMKKWKFFFSDGDIATVRNSIKLFRNDTLIDDYGIVLDNGSVGLQSRKYGWIPAIDSEYIFQTIQKFK